MVPCYNEAARLEPDEFSRFLAAHSDFDFLFVDDGSTDATVEVLKDFCGKHPGRAAYICNPQNSGKAFSVRNGMLHACKKYDRVGFLDADLSAPPEAMVQLDEALSRFPEARAAFGSRVKRLGASIERNELRHLAGRVFATLANLMLHVGSYDSQCGAKMFSSKVVPVLFEAPFVSNWFFDLELILREGQQGIVEVPLDTWLEKGGSKIKAIDFLKAPLELWRIRKHYRVK